MTLVVQTQRGDVDDANSYASVAEMRAYHTTRGIDLASHSEEALSAKLVEATDFLDARYAFIGAMLRPLQGTQCPRYLEALGEFHSYSKDIHTLEPAYLLTTPQWQALVKACIQLAYRALTKSGGLMPDPTFDATGQKVQSKTTKAGPIESSVTYAQGQTHADSAVPSYPSVDMLLRNVGLVRTRSGGMLSRG